MFQLQRDECEQILKRNAYGRLACYSPSAGETYVVPISYTYRDGSIYFASIQGQKLDFLREHPSGVSFQVDEIDNEQSWFSVLAVGEFAELEGSERDEQEAEGLRRAEHGPLRFFFAPDKPEQEMLGPLVLCALRVNKLTGRRDRWSWGTDFERALQWAGKAPKRR